MKKEGRKLFLLLIVVSLIFLIVFMPLVSAALFDDIKNFFRDLFKIGDNKIPFNEEGELASLSGTGSNDYDSNDYNKKCLLNEADINRDGIVDQADYVVWREKLGCVANAENNWCNYADVNRDGIVNDEDYKLWKAHFGEINCLNLDLEISIATLKDTYEVGEKIELTDPPDSIGNKIDVNPSNSLETPNILYDIDNNGNQKIINERGEYIFNENYTLPKYNGYIIEFEGEPAIVKKTELDKESLKNQEYVENSFVLNPNALYTRFFKLMPKNVNSKVRDYRNELKTKNKLVKDRILNNINEKRRSSITGNTISESEEELKVLNEFDTAFNGIALDINDEEAKEIKKIPGVKSVSPNYEVHATMMDSVPLIQGGIEARKLDTDGNDCTITGKECLTGKGVTIGIIDTGIDYTHPDLGNCTSSQFLSGTCDKVVGGWNFVNNGSNPMDDMGHGTHVAGIAAGNGVLKGVAPDAKLYAYKVLNEKGSGWDKDILKAIDISVDPNQDGDYSDMIDVISLSLGSSNGNPDDPKSLQIDNIVNAGVIAVVSAGNSGPYSKTIGSPGTSRKAITVGASYKKDYDGSYWDLNPRVNQITYFSSRGPVEWEGNSINKPDVVAPGAIICSSRYDNIFPEGSHPYYKPCLDENHVQLAGTSMSAPIVSGAVALLKQRHPDWSPEEIKEVLKNSAKDLGYDINTQGRGLINLNEAIKVNNKPLVFDLNVISTINPIKDNFIDINGTIKGDSLDKYTLYYGIGENPTLWNEIITNSNPIDKGILYSKFDTSIFLEGKNWFKLTVLDKNGKSYEIRRSIIKTFDVQITKSSSSQYEPSIYDDKIVFRDFTNQEYNIYLYDLSTNQERKITSDVFEAQYYPSIYQDKIVYEHEDSYGYFDIYMYDLSTNQERRITNDQQIQRRPSIYGNIIAWEDERNIGNISYYDADIYMYNLSSNQERRITYDGSRHYFPKIYNNKILWIDYRNDKNPYNSNGNYSDIYMYDLNNNKEELIAGGPGFQTLQSIYENKIVWIELNFKKSPLTYDLYIYDLNTHKKKLIVSDKYDKDYAEIYKDKIVWTDYRNGNGDIYMYDLSTNQEKRITYNPNRDEVPSIYDNKIVWASNRNGNYDIYMYDLSYLENKSYQCSDSIDNDQDGLIDYPNDPGCENAEDNDETDMILPRPQSKIVNNVNTPATGTLRLELQKKVNNNWIVQKLVYSGNVTIPSNSLIKLDVGSPYGWNLQNVTAQNAGEYRVYASFKKDNYIIENSWNFSVV